MTLIRTRVYGAVANLLTALLAVSSLFAQPQGPAAHAAPVDQTRLENTEELSESLANDMLDLSAATREQDVQRTQEFFPPRFAANPFPSHPGELRQEVKWIGKHGWTSAVPAVATGTASQVRREDFLRGWFAFLAHFKEMEDVRFKVKASQFDDSAQAVLGAKAPTAKMGAAGNARIAFYVVGRDPEGRREWARGTAEVRVRYAENKRWQFQSFTLTSLDSMVATRDLFSEVAVPAGVNCSLPAFGSPQNRGFAWHGAVAADFNNDGWMDVFATGADHSRLYLNDGHGRFRDVSHEMGLDLLDSGVAPIALDYDNDGDEDIFISSVGAQILLQNRLTEDGKLVFRDLSLKAGVAVQAIGFSASAGDVNGDGLPDIYVASYNYYGQVVPDSWFRATNGTPNLLFINQGDGTFREEAAQWGVDDRRWSYSATFADVNGDGRLDLYVVNDFGENGMFINHGNRFVDEAKERGVLDPGNGMGVAFGDYNNDGQLDLHVTNMSSTAGNRILSRLFPNSSPKDNVLKKLAAGNDLYEATGDGHYRAVTAEVGGFSGGWAWGGGFLDFDNDGWEDVFTPNGFISGKSMKDT